MKRSRIPIDEELDEAPDRKAHGEGPSEAALVRRVVRRKVKSLRAFDDDPLARWIGGDAFDPEPADSAVYR